MNDTRKIAMKNGKFSRPFSLKAAHAAKECLNLSRQVADLNVSIALDSSYAMDDFAWARSSIGKIVELLNAAEAELYPDDETRVECDH